MFIPLFFKASAKEIKEKKGHITISLEVGEYYDDLVSEPVFI